MIERRWLNTQGAIQKNLTRRGQEQVCAPDHFGDLHGRIIHHHRELVGWQIVLTPDIMRMAVTLGTLEPKPRKECATCSVPLTPPASRRCQ